MPIPRENKIYTYKDYLSWPDNERWEIIDGNAYLIAPPSRIHQEILREIFTGFAVYLKDKPCLRTKNIAKRGEKDGIEKR
ncbi:Putative restriction endonuclease [Caldanaerobius fijiensis DSM 17918]|uniref:Putative restriction endonuclease n=1 Tax=Caldanaerobius fijiensis DSM 17918 TaxID=1121256 RepID=A0A1M5F3Q9_9THEO|nr:Putative restriction endonuclease [Caldanaerobius fijiensis DSM 17918]